MIDQDLRPHLVAETIIASMRTSGKTDLLVAEDHERIRPVIEQYQKTLPGAEVILAVGEELAALRYEERE